MDYFFLNTIMGISRGPDELKEDFRTFPKREDGRSWYHHIFHRKLIIGETIMSNICKRSAVPYYCVCKSQR